MAKKRPSVHKRQREHLKRQRDQKKAEKLARRRERRLKGDQSESDAMTEPGDTERDAPTENADPVE